MHFFSMGISHLACKKECFTVGMHAVCHLAAGIDNFDESYKHPHMF